MMKSKAGRNLFITLSIIEHAIQLLCYKAYFSVVLVALFPNSFTSGITEHTNMISSICNLTCTFLCITERILAIDLTLVRIHLFCLIFSLSLYLPLRSTAIDDSVRSYIHSKGYILPSLEMLILIKVP